MYVTEYLMFMSNVYYNFANLELTGLQQEETKLPSISNIPDYQRRKKQTKKQQQKKTTKVR